MGQSRSSGKINKTKDIGKATRRYGQWNKNWSPRDGLPFKVSESVLRPPKPYRLLPLL